MTDFSCSRLSLAALLIALAGCGEREAVPLKTFDSRQPDAYIPDLPDAEPPPDAEPIPDADLPDFEVPVVACGDDDSLCPLLHRCEAGVCQPYLGGHYLLTELSVTEPAGAANLLTAAFRATLNQGDLRLILEGDGYQESGDFRWYIGYADEAPLIRDGCPTDDLLAGKYVYRHDQPIFPLEGSWSSAALRPPPDAGLDEPDAGATPDPLAPTCTPTGLVFTQREASSFTLTYPTGPDVVVPDPLIPECADEGDVIFARCYTRLAVQAQFEIAPCLLPEPEGAEALLTPKGPALRGRLSGTLPEAEVRRLNIVVGGIQSNLASLLASQGVLPTVDTNADGASDAYPFEFEFLSTPTAFVDEDDARDPNPVRAADEQCDRR